MSFIGSLLLAALTVGTWNGKWFPSGRAEHRASPAVEAATIEAAGKLLRQAYLKADPSGTNDLILCLNEIRGPAAARKLCTAMGLTNLQVAIVSGYRRRDRFDMQQDVIATTLPIVSTNWCRWKSVKAETPPRGYAHALIAVSPAVTASVYAVHLKSNYGQKKGAEEALNRAKRLHAVEQIITAEHARRGAPTYPVIVAGDFNADFAHEAFKEDTLFDLLTKAGYQNTWATVPRSQSATYDGGAKWGKATFDYVFMRGFIQCGYPIAVPAGKLSDHYPVFVTLDIQPGKK